MNTSRHDLPACVSRADRVNRRAPYRNFARDCGILRGPSRRVQRGGRLPGYVCCSMFGVRPVSALTVAHHSAAATAPAVLFDRVSLAFDDQVVLRDVSFSVARGHMKVLLGASGSGKSVLLKLLLGLIKPDSGTIAIDGERVDTITETEWMRVRAGIGMLFQEGALFDSLTVADNVGYRLYQDSDVPAGDIRSRIDEVLGFVGLTDYSERLPSELSGGQRRRVGLARAIIGQPALLLFDEPTSGLDPITARGVDREIIKLRDLARVTSVLATHQLRDVIYVATHQAVRHADTVAIVPADRWKADQTEFLMLKDGRIHFEGSAAELLASADPYLVRFLSGFEPPVDV